MILPGQRIRANGIFGTVSVALSSGATSFNSAELSGMTTIISDHAIITFDPLKQYGEQELVLVTSHPSASTTATIQRGMFGSTARAHVQGTLWAHAATNDDFTRVVTAGTRPADPYESQMIYEKDTASYKMFNGNAWVDLGAASNTLPVAMIVPTGAATAPSGWLMCEGGQVLGSTYPALATELGTGAGSRFGAATAGNIKLPDLRRAFPMGKAASGTGSVLAGTGGTKDAVAITHNHTQDAHGHGASSGGVSAAHSHNVNSVFGTSNSVHTHYFGGAPGEVSGAPQGAGREVSAGTTDSGGPDHGHAVTVANGTATNQTAGASGTDQNLPPWLSVNYIIKAH